MTELREELDRCPWCGGKDFSLWCKPVRGFKTVVCSSCEIIFVQNRLSPLGLKKYYSSYYSSKHQLVDEWIINRHKMYLLEFKFIKQFIKNGNVLDVGCSGGEFLNYFKEAGFKTFGIEYGKEAAEVASKYHEVWEGDLIEFKSEQRFDLIIFRGVIEHVSFPKLILEKAIDLLEHEGLIFITSTPNSASICSKIYKEKWNQHEPEGHIYHFSPKHFDEFFEENNFSIYAKQFFYEETPYSNPKEDVLKVARAIKQVEDNQQIVDVSPPFYGTMMSLVYIKN